MNQDDQRQPTVVVAYEPGPIRDEIQSALVRLHPTIHLAADGNEAWSLILSLRPDLLVVDAAIDGLASFELGDRVAGRRLPTRIILIASIYDKTAYKRRPTSLYGADDYVEQHHIPDMLGPKAATLLDMHMTTYRPGDGVAATLREAAQARFEDGLSRREHLDRMAWMVACDLVIYNDALLRLDPDRFSPQERADVEAATSTIEALAPDAIGQGETLILNALQRMMTSQKASPADAETKSNGE
ncbi:MAG: response regulator [Deltaproteobacteria bacterium]|nr:response regulator [Deltaproteobacteria bacterium]